MAEKLEFAALFSLGMVTLMQAVASAFIG